MRKKQNQKISCKCTFKVHPHHDREREEGNVRKENKQLNSIPRIGNGGRGLDKEKAGLSKNKVIVERKA
jgi:hypothetical protein